MNRQLRRSAILLCLAVAGCGPANSQPPASAAPEPQPAAPPDPMPPLRPVFLTPADGELWNLFGDQILRKVSSKDTNGAYAVIQNIIQPGGGPPPHVHHDEEELFVVQEGEFEIRCGDQVRTGGPGTIAFLPRNLPHVFRNAGKTPGKVLTVITPGRFEGFFMEVLQLSPEDRGNFAKITAIAAKYHLEFLPPPGAPPPPAAPPPAAPPGK